MSKGLFVIGTGTDVGKTYVTGLLVKKLHEAGESVGYYKAAVSGNDRDVNGKLVPLDAFSVKSISGISQELDDMCPYIYEKAVSPHLASRLEGNSVDMGVVIEGYEKVISNHEYVIMEGSGGIVCPIRFDDNKIWLEDIIKELDLPCVLVADAGLGTINHVVLTWNYLRDKGIRLNGIIFNHYHKGDVMEEDNIRMCEHITGIPIIGFVEDNGKEVDITIEKLKSIFE